MTFKTREDWELKGIYEQLSPSGERNYPLFETSLFGNYFIVDGLQMLKEEGEEGFEVRRRFFVASITDALKIINDFENIDIKHESIALLQGDNYSGTNDYNSSIIEEIIHCNDEAHQDAWIYLLKNGQRVVESLLTIKETELKTIGSFYKNQRLTDNGTSYIATH